MKSVNKALRRTLLKSASAAALTDGELLTRFIASGDQSAFEEVMRRHGPMVLRVCRRVLHHAQDAEDAFQAAFLVLARKAPTIVRHELLANWLYGVAYRTALNAKKRRALRQATVAPQLEQDFLGATAAGDAGERELRSLLDDELKRLPEKFRASIVLCYLEGKSNEQAAKQLRCEIAAVQKRLSRARELLRKRLARRGVTMSVGTLAALHKTRARTLIRSAHKSG
jgi:RNA polymerase sigma factor (sigma-70 family)